MRNHKNHDKSASYFLGGEKMLDIKFIRENPELVKQGIENKNEKHNTVDDILELDGKRRALLTQVEEKKSAEKQSFC